MPQYGRRVAASRAWKNNAPILFIGPAKRARYFRRTNGADEDDGIFRARDAARSDRRSFTTIYFRLFFTTTNADEKTISVRFNEVR